MLELTSKPELDGGYLSDIQSDAWSELVERRSNLFTTQLRGFTRGTRTVRDHAIEHLAWMGSDGVIADVRRYLRGKDLRDLHAAMVGALNAVVYGWATRSFTTAAYEAVEPIVTGRRDLGTSAAAAAATFTAVGALLAINRGRAIRVMKSGVCLRAGNRALLAVVLGLSSIQRESPKEFRAPIDAGLLWRVYEAASAGRIRDSKRRGAVRGVILIFTADTDPHRTRAEASRLVRRKGEGGNFAAEALRRCDDVPEALDALVRMVQSPRRFGREARQVLRAYELAQQVLSDGLAAYYGNCGASLKQADAGLRLMKLERASRLLMEGARVLVPGTKSPTAAALARGGECLTTEQRRRLDGIERKFERVNGLILRGVERYIARNAEQFREGRGRS